MPLDDSTSRDLSSNDELSPPTTEHTHGDYALVQFEGKTKKKYYVGLVLNDSPNDEDTAQQKKSAKNLHEKCGNAGFLKRDEGFIKRNVFSI